MTATNVRQRGRVMVYRSVCLAMFLGWVTCGLAAAKMDPSATFKSYYGIEDVAMQALRPQPGMCDIKLPFFKSVIPTNLDAKNSFVLTAERGSGKTSLWCHLKKNDLRGLSYLIVEPVRDSSWLQSSLEAFIRNTRARLKETEAKLVAENWAESDMLIRNTRARLKETEAELVAQNWAESDMLDFIISRTVHDVLDNINRLDFSRLEPYERKKFFAISCLYYPGETDPVPDVLRKIVKKDLSYWALFWNSLDLETLDSTQESSSDYQYILQLSNKINVLDKARIERLRMFYNMSKYFTIKPNSLIALIDGKINSRDVLRGYLDMVKKSGLNDVLLAIDGIDEVSMFGILNEKCSAPPFTAVVKSVKPLLDMATSELIHMIMFVPDCPGTSTKDFLPEWMDKKIIHFPALKWTEQHLRDYGNFVLNFFWSHQEDPNRQLWWWQKLLWETSLPPLPKNFEELIGGEKCVKSFLKGISLPREFNALFSAFIDQLAEEKNALGTETPFVGAQSCSTVEKAIKNLKAKELQEKKGREIKEVSDSGENGREERKNDEF